MNNTKAIIDFSAYKDGDLGGTTQYIHDQMVTNATTFATPPVAMTALATLISDYMTKLGAKGSRATLDLIAFNSAREALALALARLGNYVNDTAQGDPAIVAQSGFPSYETGHSADTEAPAAPVNLRLQQGKVSGVMIARWKSSRSPSTNEVQTNIGNPNTEADWKTAGIFQGQKAELKGLTPGTCVWVRVRTVGLKGVMGEWSDPAEMMVI